MGEGRDPVLQAFDLWNENGWPQSAHGLATVTSILRIHQLLSRRADQLLAPMDLNFARYQVLVLLYFSTEPPPMSQLGKYLDLHQTTITNLVDKLQALGFVLRIPHPTDRRSTTAQLTPQGRALTKKAITRLNTGLFGDLGLTVEENQLLIGLLAKMRGAGDGFEEPRPGPAPEAAPSLKGRRRSAAPTGRRRSSAGADS